MLQRVTPPSMRIVDVQDFGRRPTGINDISSLLYLMEKRCKKDFLEIGTWFGKTTYEIAVRHPDKSIYTMDYMEDDLELRDHDIKHRAPKEDLCKYAKDLPNVYFMYINSHEYDFNSFKDVDFIFIDGDHSFEGVKMDTEKAIAYLEENGGGTIAWHDVKTRNLTEVPDYIDYLSSSRDISIFTQSNIGFMFVGLGD